jgi:hypothetical protein
MVWFAVVYSLLLVLMAIGEFAALGVVNSGERPSGVERTLTEISLTFGVTALILVTVHAPLDRLSRTAARKRHRAIVNAVDLLLLAVIPTIGAILVWS